MATNHALFFIFNGVRNGRESVAMENHTAMKSFWERTKKAGDIDNFEYVMLASSGNPNMPAGFILVTGDRGKLQKLRWENEEFLKLHTLAISSMNGYACIDGYAGAGYDQHMKRMTDLTLNRAS